MAASSTAQPAAVEAQPGPQPEAAIEDIRQAVSAMLGAERRLRGRDHNRAGELTFAQLRALAALGREREMTAGELARSADLNPASVTGMLDQLESAGIVQRHRSTVDRRVCNVALTSEGWALLERKLEGWRSLWASTLSDFSAEELTLAARVIDRITGLLDSLPSAAGD